MVNFFTADLGCDNKIAVMNTINIHNIKHCLEFHLVEPRVYLLELMAESESTIPAPKRPKRQCHFDSKWLQEFQGIGRSSKGDCVSVLWSRLFHLSYIILL